MINDRHLNAEADFEAIVTYMRWLKFPHDELTIDQTKIDSKFFDAIIPGSIFRFRCNGHIRLARGWVQGIIPFPASVLIGSVETGRNCYTIKLHGCAGSVG